MLSCQLAQTSQPYGLTRFRHQTPATLAAVRRDQQKFAGANRVSHTDKFDREEQHIREVWGREIGEGNRGGGEGRHVI